MTNAIDAQGNRVAPTSNLVDNDELGTKTYDGTAEKIAKGYFKTASTWISDEEMAGDLDIVQRNGSRIHVNGEHQPGDIINIQGMEVEYETAVSMGLVTNLEGQGVSPQEAFEADAENLQEDPEPTSLEGTELFLAQIDMASGGNGSQVLDTFASDIVQNGEISEAGFDYAAKHLGMNEQVVREQFTTMQEVGGDTLHDALEVGDGRGGERMDFLMDRYEHGNPSEQKLVRQMWLGAALGKMSPAEMQKHFDSLYEPYS